MTLDRILSADHADGTAPEVSVMLNVQHQGEAIGGPRHGGLAQILILGVHGVAVTLQTIFKICRNKIKSRPTRINNFSFIGLLIL